MKTLEVYYMHGEIYVSEVEAERALCIICPKLSMPMSSLIQRQLFSTVWYAMPSSATYPDTYQDLGIRFIHE